MCEVLAPAGDEEAFFAALNAGADAIYVGLSDFSARKGAANFTAEQFTRCAAAAHAVGARVHVALNTLVKDGELSAFLSRAREAWDMGADALIVQDIFLGRMLKEMYPSLVLHLSTQAGVCNVYGARLAKRFGFSRVILARETPLSDIRAIAREIETEVFVQGALCTCFSGQCYLSSFIGGNSGNRGLCKQPCRKKYAVDRAGADVPAYRLSLSDLCVGEGALRLAEAGVASFKIEGRMRSAAYVGAAVKYYKDIFSGAQRGALSADLSDMKRAYNRGNYTSGYAFGQDKTLISSAVQGHIGERVGTVERCKKYAGYTFVRSAFSPRDGDGFKLLRVGKEVGGAVYHAAAPHAEGGFLLPASASFAEGDEVRLTTDTSLASRVAARRRKIPVRVAGHFAPGKPPVVEVGLRDTVLTYTGEFVVQPAKSRPFTAEEFRACFCKTDGYPFDVRFEEVEIEGDCFVLKSALNALRRDAYAEFYRGISSRERPPLAERSLPALPAPFVRRQGRVAVIDADFSSPCYREEKVDIAIFKPHNYRDREEFGRFLQISEYYAWHKYLYLPAFMVGTDLDGLRLDGFDGVYAEGTFAIELCRERGLKLFAGTGFNLFDRASALAAGEVAEELALSKELSLSEIAAIGLPSAFVLCGGAVKVMELGHCLFGRRCSSCDRRARYTLTDEAGRRFPLVRYTNADCRFELYNCACLSGGQASNRLFDLSIFSDADKAAILRGKSCGMPATSGAFRRGTN